MRRSLPHWLLALVFFFATAGVAAADTPGGMRLSGPVVHNNLAVYFVHGASTPDAVPLTLEEAMVRGLVQVHETSKVNQLEIENNGEREVFVQSGDIVKGGQQDRVLMVSLVLPPRSGRLPIASFCVEQGRWSARGRESAKQFSSAGSAVPSREMKLAMSAPMPVLAESGLNGALAFAETSRRQKAIWDNVKTAQDRLSRNIGQTVTAPKSESSLQLALENEKLVVEQDKYVESLKGAGERDGDIVGYVLAVNGRVSSGDVYASNALFRKMWPKLLKAGAIEAIGKKDEGAAKAPSVDAVTAFLKTADDGKASERALTGGVRLTTHDSDQAYLFETSSGSAWVHRNYLAK